MKITKTKFTKWDSAKYLKTEEDIASYLSACFEEAGDEPQFITKALGTVTKARGVSKISRATKMSREGLYKALSGEGNPEFATILKVIAALDLKFNDSKIC